MNIIASQKVNTGKQNGDSRNEAKKILCVIVFMWASNKCCIGCSIVSTVAGIVDITRLAFVSKVLSSSRIKKKDLDMK